MPSRWLDSRIVSTAPLAVFLLFLATFAISQVALTGCGKGRLAGCSGLAGDSLTYLARRDTRPVASLAFAETAPASVLATDSTRTAWEARRASALQTVVSRFEGRLAWAFFSGLSGMLAIVSLLAAAALAYLAPEPWRAGAGGRILLVLVPAAAIAIAFWNAPEAAMSVMHPLLEETIAADESFGMRRVPAVMAFLNALRSAAAVALCFACWLVIQPRPAGEPPTDAGELDRRLDGLRASSTYLRVFLYVGTASLVAGVLSMNATFAWIQTFVRDGAALDPLRVTMVGVIGGFYSLLLASLYLPSAFLVRERARRVVAEAKVEPEIKEKALAGSAFHLTLSDVLPRVAALLAPVLAGPIGEFMKHLMG